VKLFSRARRRRPGIYLVRTRKHAGRRRENGYVGLSTNLDLRRLDHLGQGRYNQPAKNWSDLDPAWHFWRLPWWMGWPWVLAPLEFLAIRLLLPRYNVTHNLGNPRRIPPVKARAQRRARDGDRAAQVWTTVDRQASMIWRVAGVIMFAASLLMAAQAIRS
jgi:hypothetical protein